MTGGSRRCTPDIRKRGEWFHSMPPKPPNRTEPSVDEINSAQNPVDGYNRDVTPVENAESKSVRPHFTRFCRTATHSGVMIGAYGDAGCSPHCEAQTRKPQL